MMLGVIFFLCFFLKACGPVTELSIPTPQRSTTTFPPSQKSPIFRIINLNIGQGDAALLIAPSGEAALIDTGPPDVGDQQIRSVLLEQKIESLKYVFISHDHLDHRGSLSAILASPFAEKTSLIDKMNIPLGETLNLGSVSIDILAANGLVGEKITTPKESQDENSLSHALMIRYKNFSYFTSGDLPGGGGNPPYQTVDLETPLLPLLKEVTIFKVAHHGSHTATFEPLLNRLAPEAAIISVGNNNDFFHPHPSVIDRLIKAGIDVYQTERGWLPNSESVQVFEDHICTVTDGTLYRIKPYSVDNCKPQL